MKQIFKFAIWCAIMQKTFAKDETIDVSNFKIPELQSVSTISIVHLSLLSNSYLEEEDGRCRFVFPDALLDYLVKTMDMDISNISSIVKQYPSIISQGNLLESLQTTVEFLLGKKRKQYEGDEENPNKKR